ncbi:hypothetical protein OH77DRAFT_1176933 [Trametes cingulata]|nr:hypothetical protein OH77DRAFT_1176933 [Trametes cingulata]
MISAFLHPLPFPTTTRRQPRLFRLILARPDTHEPLPNLGLLLACLHLPRLPRLRRRACLPALESLITARTQSLTARSRSSLHSLVNNYRNSLFGRTPLRLIRSAICTDDRLHTHASAVPLRSPCTVIDDGRFLLSAPVPPDPLASHARLSNKPCFLRVP